MAQSTATTPNLSGTASVFETSKIKTLAINLLITGSVKCHKKQ